MYYGDETVLRSVFPGNGYYLDDASYIVGACLTVEEPSEEISERPDHRSALVEGALKRASHAVLYAADYSYALGPCFQSVSLNSVSLFLGASQHRYVHGLAFGGLDEPCDIGPFVGTCPVYCNNPVPCKYSGFCGRLSFNDFGENRRIRACDSESDSKYNDSDDDVIERSGDQYQQFFPRFLTVEGPGILGSVLLAFESAVSAYGNGS